MCLCLEYQCVYASDHMDQSSKGFGAPSPAPTVVNGGNVLQYPCEANKFVNDATKNSYLDVTCDATNFVFNYDSTECVEHTYCGTYPPANAAITVTPVDPEDDATLGWRDERVIE